MSARGLAETSPIGLSDQPVSAPSSADFYFNGHGEAEHSPPPIADILLDIDQSNSRELCTGAVDELHSYMKGLLRPHRDYWDRRQAASWYGAHYRKELDIDPEELSPDQHSAQVLSRLYLSSVSALSELGIFLQTMRWTGRKSDDSVAAKVTYLRARKDFQDDMDDFLDHFRNERTQTKHESLMETVGMARLLVTRRAWVDGISYTNDHIFVGSALSERMVKHGVQRMGHTEARYGDEDEDRSPIKADVVLPREDGDFHVQVKMRWKRPRTFQIKPNKRPMHVYIPMNVLRSQMSRAEIRELRTSIALKIGERTALQTGVVPVQLATANN